MQLLLMIDAFKRASAWRITAVVPYYPYARQDRKDRPRVAISAKLVADLLETAGSSRVLTLDLHAPQIQGYFNIPVDHLFASPVLVEYFQKMKLGPITVVSPDAGGVERARFFAKKIDAPLAIVDKRRIDVNVSEVMHLIGDVAGRPALVIDDIIDTAGTLVKTAEALLEHGATKVFAACTHPVLSGPAVERIAKSKIEQVVVSDSVPLNEAALKLGKIKALSVAPAAGARDSVHSRRDFDQRIVYLAAAPASCRRISKRKESRHEAVKPSRRNEGIMETFTIEGQVREGRGKGPARRTRLTGMVPAILYGGKKDSISHCR